VAAHIAIVNICRCSCQYLQGIHTMVTAAAESGAARAGALEAIGCPQRVAVVGNDVKAHDREMQQPAYGPKHERHDAALERVCGATLTHSRRPRAQGDLHLGRWLRSKKRTGKRWRWREHRETKT
jgi:hypothetical protein